MKEPSDEKFNNQAKPPCKKKGFDTYIKLLEEATKQNRAAYECLGYICKNKVIPSYCRRYHWIRSEDVEEACWDALCDFIFRLNAGAHDYNISWLWKKANFRIIDFIRKKDNNILSLDEIENWPVEIDIIDLGSIDEKLAEFKTKLTADEALLFDLHYLGTNTIQQVRDLLGWPNGTISRLKESINRKAKDFPTELGD